MTAALALPIPAPPDTDTSPSEAPSPAPRVVIRAAPRREPPFDDEIDDPRALPRAFDRRLPFDRPAARSVPTLAPRRSALPDPSVWSRRLLVGLIETAGGRRPLHQLAALLSLAVTTGLRADLERAARGHTRHWLGRGAVRSVRASEPVEGVAEVCATVETGDRVRAVAMRLEQQHGRWRCTRLQLG